MAALQRYALRFMLCQDTDDLCTHPCGMIASLLNDAYAEVCTLVSGMQSLCPTQQCGHLTLVLAQ